MAEDPRLPALISELREAVEKGSSAEERCKGVKAALEEAGFPERGFLPGPCLEASETGYARHLLYRHPEGIFSVVVMVWAPGQGTPIHDHAGLWCVECVYEGRIRVHSYDLLGPSLARPVDLRRESTVVAGCGEAGALIPPREYHVIENPFEAKAVSIHVYGGDMDWCHVYEPLPEGGFRRERKPLAFTSR